MGFADLVTDFGVNVFGEVRQERLLLVLVKVFRKKEERKQLVKHVQEDVRFAGIAQTANLRYPKNIRGHGGVLSPVAVGRGKGGLT